MHGTAQSSGRPMTGSDVELIERLALAEARESFWAYRQWLRPKMLIGWWQEQIARELQRFWVSYQAGRRPRLLLEAPPQHGKSEQVADFMSWVAGHAPDTKIIFASFSARLGVRANLRMQRTLDGDRWRRVFAREYGDDLLRNSEIIETGDGEGYFRNTTVQGRVTGEGLDLGVIDDPIKGRAEASSKVVRDKVWSWMTDDFMGRFSDKAALLMIMTRWHLDDPAGRLIEHDSSVRVVRYPALAVEDEIHRRAGEPLFPELKTREFLEKQRGVMTQAGWESIYQQSPIVVGGGLFPVEKFETIPAMPTRDVHSAVRYWDKAGTAGGGAYTAGVMMLKMRDGTFVVTDVRRGQWSALDRERIIKQTADVDKQTIRVPVKIYVEQEPGSGGKESAESTVRMLAGHSVGADRVTGSKEVRAEPYAAQVQAGNVTLVAAEWNREFLDEHEQFPGGKYKDQVDATAAAFNMLTLTKSTYDSTMAWVS